MQFVVITKRMKGSYQFSLSIKVFEIYFRKIILISEF